MEKIRDISEFHRYCDWCTKTEPKLEPVIKQFGYPPFWHRTANFATLILTLLEQQVSLASAKAAYTKLELKIGDVTPEKFVQLTDDEIRECYFSRQKLLYSKILANEIISGKLDLSQLNKLPADEIRSRLIQLKGIGHWTIDMYLLMSLHFSDIFPPGDLATIKSVYELNLVPLDKSKEYIINYMKVFSPYQSVATYILWDSYIKRRNLNLE